MKLRTLSPAWLVTLLMAGWLVAACQPQSNTIALALPEVEEQSTPAAQEAILLPTEAPFPTRPVYGPGELVDYTAQPGDTLPALAVRFNTAVSEILAANTFIPQGATTMPPGMPMKIPIYYLPLWGSPYQIIPDSLFINGPAQVGFDTSGFVAAHPGWLKGYTGFASGANRSGAEIVDLVAHNFSLSPRLLLALLEFQAGALSQPELPPEVERYTLGNVDRKHEGMYLQLVWAANTLNNAYYNWRTGDLASLTLLDGTIERPDPWQNAATVSLRYYFSLLLSPEKFVEAVSPTGLAQVYQDLFGNAWENVQPHIPGSLRQPDFVLPFEVGKTWAYTGGPHTGWGSGTPLAALDFAPPSVVGGCRPTEEWVTAVAPGVVVRSEPGIVVLDLDGDADERTGWVVFHLHVGDEGRALVGAQLQTGDKIGHPSCEGGRSTGTHVHIARKYNGEWIPAEGALAFNLEGWIAENGSAPYLGTLTRFTRTVTACVCSNGFSFITAGERDQ